MRFLYIFVKKNSCHLLFQTCGRSKHIEMHAFTQDMEELYFCTDVDNILLLKMLLYLLYQLSN